MSVHVEWMSARHTSSAVVSEGDEMQDGQNVTKPAALVLDADECVVIEGTYAELRKFAAVAAKRLNVEDHVELTLLVDKVKAAAQGDSNDDEIEALQNALNLALGLLDREDIRG